jgi:serine/threonine-protein kinase HipA
MTMAGSLGPIAFHLSRRSSYFGLTAPTMRQIAREAGRAVAKWRTEAAKLGLNSGEIDRVSSAFEHEDAKTATRS